MNAKLFVDRSTSLYTELKNRDLPASELLQVALRAEIEHCQGRPQPRRWASLSTQSGVVNIEAKVVT